METKKLSIEEQCKRIKEIMKNDNMTTCDNCFETYLALSEETEIICPFCGNELFNEDDYDVEDLLELF